MKRENNYWQLLSIDNTLYKLNANGVNEFSLNISAGFSDGNVKLTDSQVRLIGMIISHACKDIDFNSITNPVLDTTQTNN